MDRRTFLARTGAAVAGIAGITATASGQSGEEWRSDNVGAKDITISYDEARLQRYRPLFVAPLEVSQNYTGLYGYVCESPEYDGLSYCYYWSQYAVQEGLWGVSADSHLGDHEPVICVVDDESQSLKRVIWSNYHHYAARAPGSELHIVADEDPGEPTHPVLQVDARWHNYYYSESDQWTRGDWPLRSWPAARADWIANGFYENTSAAAIEDPQVMDQGRGTWWADDAPDRRFVRIWEFVGIGGADRRQYDTVTLF
jgi:hypothetical protein